MSADNWDDCPGCGAPESFREDYEIGLSPSGDFVFVKYEGRCEKCGTWASYGGGVIAPVHVPDGVRKRSEYEDAYREAVPS